MLRRFSFAQMNTTIREHIIDQDMDQMIILTCKNETGNEYIRQKDCND